MVPTGGTTVTVGAPFRHLDRVEVGNMITVESGIGTHIYQVVAVLTVAPTDVWMTEQWDGAWLTLTTSTPVYSSRQRLVVVSRPVSGPNASALLGGS